METRFKHVDPIFNFICSYVFTVHQGFTKRYTC